MANNRLLDNFEGQKAAVEENKLLAEDAVNPIIRKILRRNRQVKHGLAKKLLAMGLAPTGVELILNIRLSKRTDGIRPVVAESRKPESE